jgi:hypothetical protein
LNREWRGGFRGRLQSVCMPTATQTVEEILIIQEFLEDQKKGLK